MPTEVAPAPAVDPSPAPASRTPAPEVRHVNPPPAEVAVEATPEPEASPAPEPTTQPSPLETAQREAEQLRQQNLYLRGYAELGQRYLTQQQAPPPEVKPPTPEAAAKPWWDGHFQKLQHKPYWNDYIRRNPETNVEEFVAGTPPEIQREFREYQSALAQTLRTFAANPAEFTQPIVQHTVELAKEEARKIIQEEREKMETERFVSEVDRDHGAWLYATDQAGSIMRTPDGGKLASPLGNMASYFINQAKSMGIPTAQARWDFAVANVRAHVLQQMAAQPQQAAAQQPAPVVKPPEETRRTDFLERGRQQSLRAPSRSSAPPAEKTPTPTSLRDRMREQLKRDGLYQESAN